jgi:putative Holliday junction resolvase
MGRLLGLDFGEKRVGVALTDPLQIIASPFEVISYTSRRDLVARIAAICAAQEVERVVVGLPLNMDGSAGPAANQVTQFMAALAPRVRVPIVPWDERLSTRSAQHALVAADVRRKKRKGLVDKVAAQIILQHYLDAQPPA